MSVKNILILYPHFPPSNLAGVHRARLFAQHLPAFDWNPIILTVNEKYYEETPDYNLTKLLPATLRIEKVEAFSISKFRLIGDIGLRAFIQLYRKAKELILSEKIDFLYIPIPSFYCALLGRFLHESTGIKYGIDYIDPWVHEFPGSNKKFSRHWWSTQLAKLLEPIAVKKASLITGVAEGYYKPVLKRNLGLKKIVSGAMPYGGEKDDHAIVASLHIEPYLFKKKRDKYQLVYAGAMLPKAYGPLENIFKAITASREVFVNTEFHFIGTGKNPVDKNGYNIKSLAEKYNLFNSIVFEYPGRIPYLDVLVHLNISDAVFILGSTEPHYTPSKIYQGVLSNKPLLAVLHIDSPAVSVIQKANAGLVLGFDGEKDLDAIEDDFSNIFEEFLIYSKAYSDKTINNQVFENYSAKQITSQLVILLNKAMKL